MDLHLQTNAESTCQTTVEPIHTYIHWQSGISPKSSLHRQFTAAMHRVALQLAIYFAALCDVGEGQITTTGQWEKVVKEDSDWGRNLPLVLSSGSQTPRAATYRRKANPSEAKTRILFVDYQGVTWTYSQETASWTALSTVNKFSHLRGSSITSLCETRVLVFGGYKEVNSNGTVVKSWNTNLWLFDGESEEWTVVKSANTAPSARHGHRTFTQNRKESTKCQCKMSMFLYGGLSDESGNQLNDFWELQCVDDKSMKYQWIKITNIGSPPISLANLHAFSVQNNHIRWIRRNVKNAFNLKLTKKKKWAEKPISRVCSKSTAFSEQEDMVYQEEDQLLIFQLQGSLLGVYETNKNLFHCVEVNGEHTPAKILLLKNEILLVSLKILGNEAQIKLSALQTADLLKILSRGSHLEVNFQEILPTVKYPLFNASARLVHISDAAWYLVLEEGLKLHMWRFERDYLRWTLYDPDQMPRTDARFLAYASVRNNCVAIFGTDGLWIYSTNLRIWTRVLSRGNGPDRLTSYATMNSMKNGSLLLFGGIDHKASSLWMATVDFKDMSVSWKRLCCDGRQRTLKKLQRWSSAIWNNTFYVYFAKTKTSCKWQTYQARLGNGKFKWKATSNRKKSKNFCGRSSAVIERFALTANAGGDLLIEDLRQAKLKVVEMKNGLSFSSYDPLLLSSAKTIFSFIRRWDTSKNKTAVVGLESFKLPECKPGTNSSDYFRYPCRPCPTGQYSNKYGATVCTDCPIGLVTKTTGSTSLANCTCPVGKCANGKCIVKNDNTIVCLCNNGFTGESCDIPTTYLIGLGTAVTVLLIAAFLYCMKRVKRHQKAANYTRAELEIAEETVAELFEIWSVKENEVHFDRLIGQGSFGDVWTAQYRDETVAVKVLKITEQDCTNEQLQEFRDESELLRSIFHAHIVRFIGTGKTAENKPFIVLEYMEQGSVRKELDDKYGDHPMEIEHQVKYALHVAKGMHHLHGINRMHRDLKCDNLLVNNKRIVKVADLGCTKIAPKISEDDGGSVRGTRAVGTALFRAPEILRGEAYSVAVDVYSYGITLWEIMTAKYPYVEKFEQGLAMREILDDVIHSDARPEFPAHCESNLKKLAEWCWNGNPSERPTFEEIVPVLKGLWLLMW